MELKNKRRILQLLLLVALASGAFSGSAVAQSVEAVQKRAVALLTAAREKRWDEMYKYTVVAAGKQDQSTRKRMGIAESATDEEIRQKVGEWFKGLYDKVKPGQGANVRFLNKENTLAHITYRHEDLDAFYMVFVDGEWYYTLEY